MNLLEKTASALRHSAALSDSSRTWNLLRPSYEALLRLVGRRGLVRVMNGTDPIRIAPELRNISEDYESDLWKAVMAAATPGLIVADVGAHIGLYSIAIAKRVEPQGRVFAFEPDAGNRRFLMKNIELNQVQEHVTVVPLAVGSKEQEIGFREGRSTDSAVSPDSDTRVSMQSLDRFFRDLSMDLLKVDVEGYELEVLLGARGLLKDQGRKPRRIFVEVHPFAWSNSGTMSDLVSLLEGAHYEVQTLDGSRPQDIAHLGWLVASASE